MMKTVMVFGLMCAMLLGFAGVSAQVDPATPLLDMLASVPDNVTTRSTVISYADYRVLEALRGIDTPTLADFQARSDASRLWIAATGGLSSGMPLNFLIRSLDAMPEAVGFSFFDVDRSLVFGNPPGQGTLLRGTFDADRIAAAYSARGFESHDNDGVTVWCGAVGCDSGLEMNLSDRNPANPFGGEFGRQEPLAVLPDMLVDSPDLSVLESVLAAYRGDQPSLAEASDYRAVAEAAAAHGEIAQIQFVDPAELLTVDVAALRLDEEMQTRLTTLTQDYGTLPVYTLAAVADVWDGTDQLALILLAYGDADTAQAGADEVYRRMGNTISLYTGEPAQDRFEQIGAVPEQPAIYTADAAVALWALRYPVPDNAPGDDGRIASSSLGFRWLIDSFYRRELIALAAIH